MGLTEAAFAAALALALWFGMRPFVKRRHYRECLLYVAVLLWTAYLLGAERYEWPLFTPVTIMEVTFKPLALWLKSSGMLM